MTDWNTPRNGEATGHASVGFVNGQRREDGTVPETVVIEYRREGTTHTATVLRQSNAQQVEFNEADTVRFWAPDGDGGTEEIITDAILRARPAISSEE